MVPLIERSGSGPVSTLQEWSLSVDPSVDGFHQVLLLVP
jgi:hypothetical protein